ncbi:RNA/RNP complex-1-interacting phosphatase [Epargyreus clarus]|uniref:RNA/RNP complex-1-interacting phosphatase n=1 Tax=Epargyreus clarus TaxID=520877 RepID=UPI003C2C82E8
MQRNQTNRYSNKAKIIEMANKIPDRWLEYKPCGRVIEGTRIVCFKVPLKPTIYVPPSSRWTVESLLEKVPNLSAVIDLTNTNRYYNPQDLLSAGVKYKKIYMPGRTVPSEAVVNEFMQSMDELLGMDDYSLVGVHCTHGLNRTGYMVCRYLIDRLGMPPAQAIKKFEKARGYHMERPNLVNHLLG